MSLARLGWDRSWREALEHAASGRLLEDGIVGRVARVDRGLCTVLTDRGSLRASCGGDLLDAMARDPVAGPCTGDWVVLRTWSDGPLTIEHIADRRGSIRRSGASRSSLGQLLAANVDTSAAVVGLHPEPNLGRVERLLAIAWEGGGGPAVVLTKADLVADADDIAEDIRSLAGPDVTVLCTSTVTGRGLAELRALVPLGRTLAFVGASGHGKSSLVNAIVGADVLDARAIRADGKGRHTSVRRELLLVPDGGVVIDTPGLRGVGLLRDDGSLDETFPDVTAVVGRCRFSDCAHHGEPGCAVADALATGALPVRRWESYQRLAREAARAEARADVRIRAEQNKARRKLTKQARDRRRP